MNQHILPITTKDVESRMLQLRAQHVLLDRDVAALYGVETRIVNQAVRNNPRKFPEGYVITLSDEESEVLRSKLLMLESKEGKGRYSKYNFKAFTARCTQDKAQVHPQACSQVIRTLRSLISTAETI